MIRGCRILDVITTETTIRDKSSWHTCLKRVLLTNISFIYYFILFKRCKSPHPPNQLVSCLSYIASKNQLKWLGTKDELLCFLSSQLGIDNLCDFQMHDNGHACYASKAEQITCNFYTKAKTLQIQGKENAEQLKLNLIALANEKLTVEVPSVNEKQYGGEFEDPHLTVPLQTTTYHQSHQSQSLQSVTCLIIHQLNALMPVILMLKKLLSKTI